MAPFFTRKNLCGIDVHACTPPHLGVNMMQIECSHMLSQPIKTIDIKRSKMDPLNCIKKLVFKFKINTYDDEEEALSKAWIFISCDSPENSTYLSSNYNIKP